jgi:hypothetical protein
MSHEWSEARPLGLCEWFALCRNQASGTLAHPVLGEVAICDRCRAKVERIRSSRASRLSELSRGLVGGGSPSP